MTIKPKNAYLLDSMVLSGKLEGNGPIKDYIDYISDFKDSSFENSEIGMLSQAIDMLLEKCQLKDSDIDLTIGGELSNQLTTTSYTMRKHLIPLIGIYSACSTISLGIGLASMLVGEYDINKILVFTSSNNQSAERQFRNPVEYGGAKEGTQTFTSTIAAPCIICSDKTGIKIEAVTIGKVIDVGFEDALDFGRAMAPAAIETLLEHFKQTNHTPKDYDLILTGDLSSFGYEIVSTALEEEYGKIDNYKDCGLLLYDVKNQHVFAGGSGPGTSAGVLLSYVKKQMERKVIRNVLLCATGVLMNPTMINQKNSLPCIAHCIELKAV